MSSLQVPLTEAQKEFVDGKVAAGGYANPGDYVRRLIEAEVEHDRAVEALLPPIRAGLNELSHGHVVAYEGEAGLDALRACVKRRGRERLGGADDGARR